MDEDDQKADHNAPDHIFEHQEAKNICMELLEQVEDIKTQMCDHYCRYRDEWDEDDGPIEDVICKSCPLTRL